MCEISSQVAIKTSEWCQWRRCGVFNDNFEHTSHISLLFPLLTFEQVNTGWVCGLIRTELIEII